MEQHQDDHLLEGLARGLQSQSFWHLHQQHAQFQDAQVRTAVTWRASLQQHLGFFPAPSIIDDGVVYLQARVKFMDLKVFVLALDTRDNKLLGAVEFATKRVRGASVVYFPSNIGKYIDPEDRVMPIPEGTDVSIPLICYKYYQ